jgi:hypothetical protein
LATGQQLADEARADLNDGDASNVRWTDAEILRFINAAQRQIVLLLPEANIVEEEVTLVVGSRQTLPAAGVKFLGLYNVFVDDEDTYRGKSVTVVEEDALDSSLTSWMYESIAPSTAGVVDHVLHDPRDPKAFAVYPAPTDANPTDAFVKYAKLPTALATLASTFGLGDEYINPAVEYTKFRMLMKDGRYGSEPGVRLELWNTFRTSLGLKPQTDMRVDPSRERAGGDENG